VEGDIKYLVTVRSQTVLNPESVRRLVAHELGHVLGIAQHSPRAADLLHATNIATAEPSPADRATLHVLYQSPADITP
jgi:predicted Zn-dependent protease